MIGWVDASSGASGDMLLGALLDAGVAIDVLASPISAVAPEHTALSPERVTRGAFAATRCHVEVADSSHRRTWRDVAALLADADLDAGVRDRAMRVFERLAEAEATVHGISADDVHFHEVGALDAIADVVGVCAGLAHLGLDELVVSPVAVGSGTVSAAHGAMPVPPPAVAELLRGVPSYAGPVPLEMCTPTGAALLSVNASSFGVQPPMVVRQIGVGAGGRDPEGHANVLRLFLGDPLGPVDAGPALIECNVDDMDPRLWPEVLAALMTAGASDAWLTPILMKKGRPAHTLSVLAQASDAPALRREVFRQTSTIGVRETTVGKHALDREIATVTISGQPVRVKIARLDGEVLNAQPEYDDVARAARASGRTAREVLAESAAAAQQLGR